MSKSPYTMRLPAFSGDERAPELVLLHGWGMDCGIWSDTLQLLRKFSHVTLVDLPGFGRSQQLVDNSLENYLQVLAKALPEKAVYLGFSLGGMLAVKMAEYFPSRVSALVTISSNARFVADDSWPHAMDKKTFASFYQLTQAQPEAAFKMFLALQARGCESERKLLKQLKKQLGSEVPNQQAMTSSLLLLSELDNSLSLQKLQCPSLHLYGENDGMVPLAAAQLIKNFDNVEVHIVAGASHVPFISHPQQCFPVIENFLRRQISDSLKAARLLDKRKVARSFSRAAESYDKVAFLQRRVGESLLGKLPDVTVDLSVDLGCGTGFFVEALQNKLKGDVVAFDLAEGMTRYVKQHNASRLCVCGDAENIPLADASVDCIYSSLAIQWCEDNQTLFAEIFRVLKPGGKMLFSTLGPDTLAELKQAWSAVDDYVHVNRFVGRDSLQRAVKGAGFGAMELSEEMITLEYEQLKDLTRELKGIGAHNINEGRPAGLTGRYRIKQLLAAYESQRNERGMLPATYQVWYGVLEK